MLYDIDYCPGGKANIMASDSVISCPLCGVVFEAQDPFARVKWYVHPTSKGPAPGLRKWNERPFSLKIAVKPSTRQHPPLPKGENA